MTPGALFIITDTAGDAVDGATVTLHEWPVDYATPAMMLGGALEGTSALNGEVRIAVPGRRSDLAHAAWVSHAQHIAKALPEVLPGQWTAVAMDPSAGLVVRVVDQNESPRAGVAVLQTSLSLGAALALQRTGPPWPRAGSPPRELPAFRRAFITDEEGVARAHPCGFPVVVRAHQDGLASASVIVEPGQRAVELVLTRSAKALGSIRFPPGFKRQRDVQVDLLRRPRGTIGRMGSAPLGTAFASPNGAWGPLEFALDEEFELVFQLHGGGLVPVERVVDPRFVPSPYVVDFQPEEGLSISAYVFESTQAGPRGIPGASVAFHWLEDGSQRIRKTADWTDEHGMARIEGCPRTTGSVHASAAGYANHRVDTIGLPRAKQLDIELDPGGTVEGRCLFEGRPVTSFDILLWGATTSQRSVHVFRDRDDGSFRVEGTPFGPVQVIAVPANLCESETHQVDVPRERPAQLEIEIPRPVIGHGRVIDAETHEPISSANIFPLVTAASVVLGERGDRFRVDPDGYFELEDFPAKNAAIRVEAEGYGRESAYGSYVVGEGIQFGEISLSHTDELLVRILGGGGVDVTQLWVQSEGANPIPYHQIQANGEVRIPDVHPGRHDLCVVRQDGSYIQQRINLVAGRPWVVEFEVPEGQELVVDIVAEDDSEPLPSTGLIVTFWDKNDRKTILVADVPPDGRVVFPSCSAGQVWLELVGPDSNLLAFERIEFEEDEPRHVTLELSGRSLAVNVVDAEGNPLPEIQVEFATLDENQPESTYHEADANGRVVFRGIHADEVVVTASNASSGWNTQLVSLSRDELTEVEIVLDGGHDLTMRMVDGESLVPGIGMDLHGSTRATLVALIQADSNAMATWPRMAMGRYMVHVDHPGIWETWHTFDFGGEPEPIDVPVRRLGDLEVQVVDLDGLALTGVPLELISAEYDEPLGRWVAEHRVIAEPTDLVTDIHGQVRAHGIPHGAYLLRLQSPLGAPIQQTLVVPPADTLRHLVVLE